METSPKIIKTESIILTQLEEDIIKITPNPSWNKVELLENAKINHAETLGMAAGKNFSLICFLGATTISKEARDYYKSVKPEALKVAFVTHNFFQKMIATFFIGISKLPVPTRLFSSEAEALKWLRESK